jgi:putative membrane protein
MQHDSKEPSVWKGALAGIAGGLVGAWAMNQFQAELSKASHATAAEPQRAPSEQRRSDDDATMKAAEAISETVAGHRLSKQEKQKGGSALHYAFGSSMGAAYGIIAELAPRTTTAGGLPFGAALWLAADEIAVPALGLSKSPLEYPASTHASALASHFVYGMTADLVRRTVRAAW